MPKRNTPNKGKRADGDRPAGTRDPKSDLTPSADDRIFDGLPERDESREEEPQAMRRHPLMAMPMKLEYRYFDDKTPVSMLDTEEIARTIAKFQTDEDSDAVAKNVAKAKASFLNSEPKIRSVEFLDGPQIWFRWYPDSNFALDGVTPASEEEKAELAKFDLQAIRSGSALTDSQVDADWMGLSARMGPERLAYLVWYGVEDAPENWEQRLGRICGLPDHVELYAYVGDERFFLGRGAPIPQNQDIAGVVNYAPDSVDQLTWLTDFNLSVLHGMGVKLKDPEAIQLALKADWIVAVGVRQGSTKSDFENLFKDQIANGQFALMDQDTPTNNSPTASTDFSETRADQQNDIKAILARFRQTHRYTNRAANQISRYLGLDLNILKSAKGAENTDHLAFASMLRVIGPTLLDDNLDGSTLFKDIDENQMIEALAKDFSARGVMPSVRMGDNAYGIVPVTLAGSLDPDEFSSKVAQSIAGFAKNYDRFLVGDLEQKSAARSMVLKPDDPDASEKLSYILYGNSVSRRIEVAVEGQHRVRNVACPYVKGKLSKHWPHYYLPTLYAHRLNRSSIPDPTDADGEWPLLYRLARRTLSRQMLLEAVRPVTPVSNLAVNLQLLDSLKSTIVPQGQDGFYQSARQTVATMETLSLGQLNRLASSPDISNARLRRMQRVGRKFETSLKHLAKIGQSEDGVAKLEVLMMEVIDFFQYRLDAWKQGFALLRLAEQRKDQRLPELRLGYYGFLGKLRTKPASKVNNEYIQAPGLAQATTAAVLRSAHMRNRGNGAFAVGLSPHRLRRALQILENLRKGLSIGESLGIVGERWLRDHEGSGEILPLRLEFPIENSDFQGLGENAPANRRIFDGRKFITAPRPSKDPTMLLHDRLKDSLDALADLIMAEAVHQRAMGASEAANAWIQVMSGGPVPAEPAFIKTQRQGQASDHRITLLLPEPVKPKTSTLLTFAEPNLTALAYQMEPDFDQRSFVLTITDVGSGKTIDTRTYSVLELSLSPVDMLVQQRSEIEHRILRKYLMDANIAPEIDAKVSKAQSPVTVLEKLPGYAISIAASKSGELLSAFFDRFEILRKIISRSKHLWPEDMTAGASPKSPLTEVRNMALLETGIAELANRVGNINERLEAVITQLKKSSVDFFDFAVAEYLENDMSFGSNTSRDRQFLVLGASLNHTIIAASEFDAVSRSALLQPQWVLENQEQAVAHVMALIKRLRTLHMLLHRQQDKFDVAPRTTLSELKAVLNLAKHTLTEVIGRETFPIFPRFEHGAETTPLLDNSEPIADGLAEWMTLRKNLRPWSQLQASLPRYILTHISRRATEDDTADNKDPRPESEAPRSFHFGKIIAAPDTLAANSFAGVIVDEWVEVRPSEVQSAALAVNYDSPQAEAPNAILCCIPPPIKFKGDWTSRDLAEHARETIRWMQIRAASTQNTGLLSTIFPGSNRVSYKTENGEEHPRIPVSKTRGFSNEAYLLRGKFRDFGKADTRGLSHADFTDITGFSKKRRT